MRNKNKQWLVALMTTLTVGCASIGVTNWTSVSAESKSADSYVTAGENVTLTAAGGLDSGLVGGMNRYVEQFSKGLKASSSTMSGTVMSNAIDMSKIGTDPLIRFFPCDTSLTDIQVKIIDVANTSNTVTIDYAKSNYFPHERGDMYLGVDTTITYETADGYVTTDATYEYGQIIGDWWALAWQHGFGGGGFGADLKDGEGERWVTRDDFERFWVSYDNGKLVTTRTSRELPNWSGFGGTNVYVQLSWESTENDSGLLIDCLAGIDFTAAEVDGGDKISTVKSEIPSEEVLLNADSFVTAGENVTVSPAGGLDSGLAGGMWRYVEQFSAGLKASSSTTSGVVMSNAVNLSEVGSAPLVRFFPCDTSLTDVEVRLIDATDTNNVVVINYAQSNYFPHERGDMYLGVDTSITYKTANGYTTTSAAHDYGQIIGDWWALAWHHGLGGGGFGANLQDGKGERWVTRDDFERFWVSYDNGKIVTTRTSRELPDWAGFGGSEVYVQVSWESKDNDSGILIDALAGVDFTAATIVASDKISTEKAEIPASPVITSATDFVTAGENVTLTAAGGLDDDLVGGVRRYVEQFSTGLKASSSTTSGKVMSNAIDMSKVGNETLIRFFPADMALETVTVRIIDASDVTNYVVINYEKSNFYEHDRGEMYLGVDTAVTYKTADCYVQTKPTYEYGQVLGNWWPLAWGHGFEGGMGADLGDGQGHRWVTRESFDRFSVSYDNGELVTTRASRALENWSGFGGANVYVELSWTSSEANSGLLIDCLAGLDFSVVTIDAGDKISTTKAAVLSCEDTGHAYFGTVTAPTCTEVGYTTYVCSSCADSYVDNEVAATGHSYSSVVTAPTCTVAGYTTYTCACGDSYTGDEVAATGHSYSSVVTAPTCNSAGYTTYTCSVCGDSYVGDETAPLTHEYSSVVTAPTCTVAGYTTYTCKHCGDSYTDDQVAATGHTSSDWIVDSEAKVGEAGSQHKECTVCGETLETEEISALESLEAPFGCSASIGGLSISAMMLTLGSIIFIKKKKED